MFEDAAEVIAFLEEAGLSDYLDFFEELCAPSLCLEAADAGSSKPANGASLLGGAPHLPASMAWPVRDPYPHGKLLAEKLAAADRS